MDPDGLELRVLLSGETAFELAGNQNVVQSWFAARHWWMHCRNCRSWSQSRPVNQSRSTGLSPIPTVRIMGDPHPPRQGDPTVLRQLLDEVRAVDTLPLQDLLAHPHQFMGGDGWQELVHRQVLPVFARECIEDDARRRMEALAGLTTDASAFPHGDLAGTNILWSEGRVKGVIDWDLASLADPAEDAASLAWWHGWDMLGKLVDSGTAQRALVFRDSFPIQMVVFAVAADRPQPEIERAVTRAQRVMTEGA